MIVHAICMSNVLYIYLTNFTSRNPADNGGNHKDWNFYCVCLLQYFILDTSLILIQS
jgi:hypothetical protein